MEIGFNRSSYTVSEGDDSVSVCVSMVLSGSLLRPVKVTVNTEDGTATGQYQTLLSNNMHTL